MIKFRKALIRYFSSLPPNSKPCKGTKNCPIMVFRKATGHRVRDNCSVIRFDPKFVNLIDTEPHGLQWGWLTARRIVEVAKSLG